MTAMTHEPSTDMPARRDIASRLLVREFWAALSIIAMWLAVLFDGVFGGDMVFTSSNGSSSIPTVVLVALFAVFGTAAVAKRGFRRTGED
jgi:hypothetical protein